MKGLLGTTSAAVLMAALALPAAAQVRAVDVWENWQQLLTATGTGSLSVDSVVSGPGTVTVEGLRFSTLSEDVTITMDLGSAVFTEQADGSVLVTQSPEYRMTMSNPDGLDFGLLMTTANFVTVVREIEGGVLRHESSADSMVITTERFTPPNNEPGTLELNANLGALTGFYEYQSGDVMGGAFGSDVASMTMTARVDAPADGGMINFDLAMTGLTASGSAANLQLMDTTPDPIAALAGGFALAVQYGVGSLVSDVEFRDRTSTVTSSTDIADMMVEVAVDRFGVRYDVSAGATEVAATVPDLPFPFEAGFAELRTAFTVPFVDENGGAGDVAAVVRLVDLVVGEALLSMFDPGQAIPRVPTTVILDISGRAAIDPMMAAMGGPEFPGPIESLTLNELRLSFGGAEVTGSGAFTFDQSDLQTFDGLPAPTGRLQAAINGANTLLDRVATLGLVGPEEMMGIRFGLGAIGRPIGPDQLESVIEIGPGGSVVVNGMQFQ